MMGIFPGTPYGMWVIGLALLFTVMNLRGIQATARTNEMLTLAMGAAPQVTSSK